MKSFTIRIMGDSFKIKNFNKDIKGFYYPIKKNRVTSLKINELIIVSPDITTTLICHNFNKKYQKIVEYLFANCDINESDDGTDANLMIALDEVARLRTFIINKYKQFLKKKEEEELLRKLKVLENEIRIKIIDYKLIKEQNVALHNVDAKGKSR